jgi:acyl carrier protein
MPSAEESIRQFIIDNFLFGDSDKAPSTDDSLLDLGIVDSTGILELVSFLETQFKIEIDESELVPANLDSLGKLTQFLGRKTANSTRG